MPEKENCPCLVLCHVMTASAAEKATVCRKKRPLLPKRKIRLP